MNLADWARSQGIHPQTAYAWFRQGILPVPAERVGRMILVNVSAPTREAMRVGLYARVVRADDKAELDRQVRRMLAWADKEGAQVVRVEQEVASGFSGRRVKVRRILADPDVDAVVVTDASRLGRANVELVAAALTAAGRRLVILDEPAPDDLEVEMQGLLGSFYARHLEPRRARRWARKALDIPGRLAAEDADTRLDD